MDEAEWKTRRDRIDKRLRACNPPWQLIPWKEGLNTSTLTCHAVTEFPTANGPADGLSKRVDGGESGRLRRFPSQLR